MQVPYPHLYQRGTQCRKNRRDAGSTTLAWGVSGIRVAVLYTVPEIIQEQMFPGISELRNFEFGDGALVAWRAGYIGSGKRFVVDKSTAQF